MGILTLCVIVLALYVWYLATKVSGLEKYIRELKNKDIAQKQKQPETEKPAESAKPAAVEPQLPLQPAAPVTAYKISEPVIKTVLQTAPVSEAADSKIPPKQDSPEKSKSVINWEIFTGVKLFAWIGGFAAFLGIIFFTKYAIDHNLIGPLLRVCAGFGAGLVLLCAGFFTKSDKLKTTGNVLSATGIVFIYVSAFAAGSIYDIFSLFLTFSVMIAASAGAFAISVHKNAKYIAVLAAVGGYLTPILLSSGSGAIVSLSVYMAVLTVTIMTIAVKKEWGFLVWLSAIGVYSILFALYEKDFVYLRTYDMAAIFAGFCMLFTAFAALDIKKFKFSDKSYKLAPFLFNIFSMYFVFAFFGKTEYLPLALLGLINACLLFISVNDKYFKNAYAFVSGLSFIALFIWTCVYLNQHSLWTALGAYFTFFLLNAFLPFFDACKKKEKPSQWCAFFPAMLLMVLAVCAGKVYFVYFTFWIIVMLAAFFSLALSEITKNIFNGLLSVFGIFVTVFVWLIATKSSAFDEISFAGIVCGFAFGIFVLASVLKKKSAQAARYINAEFQETPAQPLYSVYNIFLVSLFVLLGSAIIKIKPAVPDVFIASGLVITLFVVFLSLINESKNFIGVFFSLVSMFLMQLLWQTFYYTHDVHKIICLWYFIVFIFFFILPFLFKKQITDKKMPWFNTALAGIFQCSLIYIASRKNPQMAPYLGAIPAVFAVIYAFATFYIMRLDSMKDEFQKSRVAIFAAVSLLFVTLIFPMQFKTQWLVVAWALESAALIGLFKLIAYKPLKYWGFWLFVIIFFMLVFPDISLFTVNAGSILNWYLYMYSVTIVSMFAGALLWFPKDEIYAGIKNRNAVFTMAVILLFVLLNTEIAAFFAIGGNIHFSFDNSLAQDMSYTLCWGVFAIGMFVCGIIKKIKALRISGLLLLAVATFKLFLHDLWSLGQLYRIGSLFGLAAMLILVSFLYQKYVIKEK